MRLIFNPITGIFEFIAQTISSTSDFLSGFYKIEISETITIPVNKQMISVGSLELNGTIVMDGQLCLI